MLGYALGSISIIAGTVIIYYQSEKDVLDYEDHELWVDTGTVVKRITFGHILKTNAIRRFPI